MRPHHRRVERMPTRLAVDAPNRRRGRLNGRGGLRPGGPSERAKPGFPFFYGSSTGIQPSHAAPAGQRWFHAISPKSEQSLLKSRFSVQYLVLADRVQSGPTEIDEGQPRGLISNGSSRALAVIVDHGALFARWIELREGLPAAPAGQMPINLW